MPTYFNPGDVVVPKVTAQGMTKGERYKVVDVDVNSTPFGDFVNYKLKPEKGGSELWVGNLHLLASKVKMSRSVQQRAFDLLKGRTTFAAPTLASLKKKFADIEKEANAIGSKLVPMIEQSKRRVQELEKLYHQTYDEVWKLHRATNDIKAKDLMTTAEHTTWSSLTVLNTWLR